MSHLSPTLEGFRVAFRRPSLTLAEISWRWTVGAAAIALFLFSLLEFLDTLPVTKGDILLLRTRQPMLIAQALGHIFRGSFPRLVLALLLAAVALTFLWIVAATVGRMTTVRSLIDYFAERQKSMIDRLQIDRLQTDRLQNGGREDDGHRQEGGHKNEGPENHSQESISLSSPGAAAQRNSRPLGSLLRLNFLRAAVALAAILGFVGVLILVQMVAASLASNKTATDVANGSVPPPNPGAGLAFLLFFPLTGLVFLAWSTLNWVLSLAGMFAVSRDGDAPRDAMSALSSAVGFCRERAGPVFAVSTWTGLAHLTLFVVATTAVSIPLSFAPIVPRRVVLIAVILVTMAYFAVADWFYVVRLAGYVCIAEVPEALLALVQSAPLPTTPFGDVRGNPRLPMQTTIDRDEVILSDLPNLTNE